MKIEGKLDYELAAKCAQRDPRKPGVLPHWLRCDWVKGDWPGTERCRLGQGHSEQHQYEDK